MTIPAKPVYAAPEQNVLRKTVCGGCGISFSARSVLGLYAMISEHTMFRSLYPDGEDHGNYQWLPAQQELDAGRK